MEFYHLKLIFPSLFHSTPYLFESKIGVKILFSFSSLRLSQHRFYMILNISQSRDSIVLRLDYIKCSVCAVADPGFLVGGGTSYVFKVATDIFST